MSDLIERLRYGDAALCARQAADDLERKDAAIAELVIAAGRLAHYAECIVEQFSSGRPHLDMTLLPELTSNVRAAIAKHKHE